MDSSNVKEKFKLKMPGAFTILFFLTVISVMLTGAYQLAAIPNCSMLVDIFKKRPHLGQKKRCRLRKNA